MAGDAGPGAPEAELERETDRGAGREGGAPPARRGLDPWLRFTLLFAVLALSSEILYYAVVLGSSGLQGYLASIARVSGGVIRLFDPDARIDGSQIGSTFFIVDIAPECDAIQLSALLSAAMISFPVSLRARLTGIALGLLWIQVVNLVRIISLYYVGGALEDHFESAHKLVWPALLIVITVGTWIAWARFVTRHETRPAGEA